MEAPERGDELPQIHELPQREYGWPPQHAESGDAGRHAHAEPPRDPAGVKRPEPPGQAGQAQPGKGPWGPDQYGAPERYGPSGQAGAPPSPSGLPPIGARPSSGRSTRYILYAFWVIEILITIRLILLLMDANPQALFSEIIYGVTEPFVIVFQNVFPSPSGEGHQLEAASVLALLVYPLLLWAILRLMALLRRRATI
ncbi:MAG TPA: YggT family protein [Ktedonobacterales bacterium]